MNKVKRAVKYPYKNGNLTINQFVDLPECRFKYAAVRSRLISGFSMDDIAGDKNARVRGVAQKHDFYGVKLSVKEFMKAVKVEISEARVRYRLAQGQTFEDIINGKKLPLTEKLQEDAPVYSSPSSAKFPSLSTVQIKAIMAVPVNVKYTFAHYMPESYIRTPDAEPAGLRSKNWVNG